MQLSYCRTYWVIDRFEKHVLVWEPDSREAAVITTELRWQPRATIAPLVLQLADILLPA